MRERKIGLNKISLIGIVGLSLIGIGYNIGKQNINQTINQINEASHWDLNRDGRKDFLIDTGRERFTILMQKEDGSYVECELVEQNGKHVYRSIDGKFTFKYGKNEK